MTRLERAVKELGAALGRRNWVLVYDPTHPASDVWGLFVQSGGHQPAYTTIGLLECALTQRKRRFLRNEEDRE